MEIKNFDAVITAYKAAEGTDLIKEGDVRSKYTEVAEALGVDTKLLRNHAGVDICKDYDRITDQTPLVVGEDDIPFVVEVVRNYCSPDYQNIRRRDFRDVPLPTIKYLIERFTKLLFDLGHERKTLVSQIESMEMVTQYSLRVQKKEALDRIAELSREIVKEKRFRDYIDYEDAFQKGNYALRKIFECTSDIDGVWREYDNVRFDIYDREYEIMYEEDTTTELRWSQEDRVEDKLRKNPEYVKLMDRKRELSQDPKGFVKKVHAELKHIEERMKEIRTETEQSLFGRTLEPIPDDFPRIQESPENVMQQAIAQRKAFLEQMKKEDEEWKKKPKKTIPKEKMDEYIRKWRKDTHQLEVWDYLQ